MSTHIDKTTTPKQDNSSDAELPNEDRLDRAADEVAEKAGKTEQRYDQEHDIFTK